MNWGINPPEPIIDWSDESPEDLSFKDIVDEFISEERWYLSYLDIDEYHLKELIKNEQSIR